MKFVNFYDIPKYSHENRVFAPSLVTVIDYLTNVCNECGETAEIISAAETRLSSGKFPFRSEEIRPGVTLTQTATRGYKNVFFRELGKIKSRLWLTVYLIKHCQRGETVFFWDSPVLYEPLILFRIWARFKDIKILYFATEIFQEILPMSPLKKKMEWYLFEKAEKLLVSTEFLNKKINPTNRPYAILHGTYQVVEPFDESFEDDYIHLVYAGVINATKGSSQAVDMAKYLSGKYRIHILGYGKHEDVELLEQVISSSNAVSECQIIYEGTLAGEEYYRFLQKCQLGLCPQNLDEAYNDSSFPSKILSYLSNGLRVLSVDLPAIRQSQVGDILYFSSSDDAKDLADAVNQIDWSTSYNSRTYIQKMHKDFVEAFKELM
ncbi:TPA: glycosyltransferase [Streptococcus suis]|nr:glycosyltransferase [Streptococcus suis]